MVFLRKEFIFNKEEELELLNAAFKDLILSLKATGINVEALEYRFDNLIKEEHKQDIREYYDLMGKLFPTSDEMKEQIEFSNTVSEIINKTVQFHY